MTDQFARLLEPGMIGPVKTRNRILKTANGTSLMNDDQTCGDRMIAYYERLAKGGVGFLVVESCGVEYPLGIQHVHYDADGNLIGGVQLHFDDDKFIPGFARLAEAIHRHGCPCSIQFQHAGPWNPTGLLPKSRDTKASSAMTEDELPGPDFNPCRAMTKQEIEDQIDLWASAAERAFKAGFDACEINHGTCHQGATFLSRVWNRRDDEYGPQSYENRTRFLRNIIKEAKRRTSPSFAVHTLFNICEFNHERATTLAEGVEMAGLIAGVADGINCRAHSYGHRGGLLQPDRLFFPEPPEDLPKDLDWIRRGKGATVPLAEAVKQRVKNIPVWTAGRLDPFLGEEFLRKGRLDFVGMTRRLLADPELPNKVAAGRLEDVRWCTGCLRCFDARNKNQKIECMVNATLGKELMPEFQFTPARVKKKVLVVGGGPAGMEAARIAAERGHEVTIYEKAPYLGGLIRLAAIVKDLETEDLILFVSYLETQLRKHGVTICLKKEATPAVVKQERPEVLVIAAGAAHASFNIPGGDSRKVIKAEKLHNLLKFFLRFLSPAQIQRLSRIWMPVGRKVVVVGGALHGCELAEFLTKRGRKVVIVHNGPEKEIGEKMTVDDMENLWPWLKKKGVPIWLNVKYERVTDKGLVISLRDKRTVTLEASHIITTQDFVPNRDAADRFKGLAAETYNIGSSNNPGLIMEAVRDGARVGFSI